MVRFVLLVLLLATPVRAQEALSGVYGDLVLAVRDDGTVEGALFSARGLPERSGIPPFTCAFLLAGRIENGEGAVRATYPGAPEVIEGRLTVANGRLVLRLSDTPPGCANVEGDMRAEPYARTRDVPGHGWTGARLVTRRTVLRASPAPDRPGVGTLLGVEAVAILRVQGNWALVEVPVERPARRGWLRLPDLSPAPP